MLVRLFICLFACTAHSCACSAQLALLARSAVLIGSNVRSLRKGTIKYLKRASFCPTVRSTVVQNSYELRRKFGATRSSVHSFSCTTHRLLHTAYFARALRCAYSFARSLTHSRARGKVNDWAVLSHSAFSPNAKPARRVC